MLKATALQDYRLLGRSGLRVSPLGLGTMTFGSNWGWGADRGEARRIFDFYLEHGGNLIDTANQYTDGSSEDFIGNFAASRRDSLVIATKYSLPIRPGDPNSGGNHRKSMICSVEQSLRRLATTYIDLLYLHAWDGTTSAEEVLRAMDDLVRSGKVLYVGISNTPAWRVSRMLSIADLRGWSPLVALQIKYNLTERTPERELIPMAREMGLGVIAWSPLGSGVLTGKYREADLEASPAATLPDGSRKNFNLENALLTRPGLEVAARLERVARELERPAAQVALAWLLQKPGVTAPILGARTLSQFRENLQCLDVRLSDAQFTLLEQASATPLGFPHDYLASVMKRGGPFGCMPADIG